MLEALSINDLFWIRIQPHQINFEYKGLPDKVHFTIAFNKKSKFINLHISPSTAGMLASLATTERACCGQSIRWLIL